MWTVKNEEKNVCAAAENWDCFLHGDMKSGQSNYKPPRKKEGKQNRSRAWFHMFQVKPRPLLPSPCQYTNTGFCFSFFLLHIMSFLWYIPSAVQSFSNAHDSLMETLISRPSAYRSHGAFQSFPQAFHKLPHSINCIACVSVSKATPPTPSPHWFGDLPGQPLSSD